MLGYLLHTTYYEVWWRGEDSNLRRRRRQIYSLFPLTAREPLLGYPLHVIGASGGIRTPDQLITNQALYRLSYAGAGKARKN
jgi:hypothetical protein